MGWHGSGGILKALKEELQEQVRILVQNESIKNPNMYLATWLLCRKLQGQATTRILPDVGAALDQDYMTTYAFEIIDEAYEEEQKLQQQLKTQMKEREQLRQTLLAQMGKR